MQGEELYRDALIRASRPSVVQAFVGPLCQSRYIGVDRVPSTAVPYFVAILFSSSTAATARELTTAPSAIAFTS